LKEFKVNYFWLIKNKLITRVKKETAVFRQLSQDSRLLLICITLFYLAGPFTGLFLNVYLWREIESLQLIALFTFFYFFGVPIGFIINGILLKKLFSKTAFQLGLFFQGLLPVVLIILQERAFHFLALLGLIKGVSAAFYWANLALLTYDFTNDAERGYFSGLSSSLASAIGIIASPLAGFVIGVAGQEWLKLSITSSYYLSFGTAIVIFLATVIIAGQVTPKKGKLEYSFRTTFSEKKSENWIKVRSLNFVTGLRDSVIPFLPALLAFKFFGKEVLVGQFNGLMAVIGILIGYFAGRYAKPEKRISAASIGVTAFF
jgi:YQGE family putative transporter